MSPAVQIDVTVADAPGMVEPSSTQLCARGWLQQDRRSPRAPCADLAGVAGGVACRRRRQITLHLAGVCVCCANCCRRGCHTERQHPAVEAMLLGLLMCFRQLCGMRQHRQTPGCIGGTRRSCGRPAEQFDEVPRAPAGTELAQHVALSCSEITCVALWHCSLNFVKQSALAQLKQVRTAQETVFNDARSTHPMLFAWSQSAQTCNSEEIRSFTPSSNCTSARVEGCEPDRKRAGLTIPSQ